MALTKITSNIISDSAITAAKLHATLDLTGKTITVATATAGDNDTTVASTAFVSTAIANLADSAPSTLNTLNELAAALGDDANFSTTVTNSIATKLPLAGGTMTGTIAGFTSTGIDDNATSSAITIDSSEKVFVNGGVNIATTAGNTNLQVLTTNSQAADLGGSIGMGGVYNATNQITFAEIHGKKTNSTAANVHGYMAFVTRGDNIAERMRIDSSGNLLVGKTSTDFAVAGTRISDDGRVLATRSGNPILTLNRLSSDGEMQRFYKDGTQAGSIGANGGYIYIGSTDTNLRFHDGADAILPATAGGASRSAAIDLGTSGAKFKDLHISGIASIGNLKIGTDQGTDGQLLTSTGSGVAWEDAPAGGPTFKTFGTGSIMIGDSTTGTINAADNNTGLGVDVFEDLTSGDSNVAIGKSALKNLTTGNENVAIGIEAMFLGTAGIGNTAIGRTALRATTANNNTAVGNASLSANTSGLNNVAVGSYALQSNTTSSGSTAVGRGALLANTAGNNTAVGYNALTTTTTATQVTALGYRAGEDSTGSSNTFLGFLAGAENSTGNQNTFIGASTAESGVCTGTSNTAVGGNNFTGITSGSYNCVMGTHAMRSFQTGEGNVAIGYNAKRLHSAGDDAVVIGNHAAYNMTTGRTVVVGNEAFYTGTSTDDSVFIGNRAGYLVTTGYTNVIIGDRAADSALTTGYANTMVGYKAGRSCGGFSNSFFGSGAGSSNTGAYNTVVGAGASVSGASNGGITIGYAATSGAAGTYATLGYGGSKSWISLGATGWSGSSDERLKENIRPSEAGLAFINDLKPVNFDWRKRKDIDAELSNHKADSDERYEQDNPTGKIGFIAQDVKAVLDNHPEVISHLWEEQEDGTQALTPNELIPMLVKAVQELSAKVEELQNG